jgi:hypothetical protein
MYQYDKRPGPGGRYEERAVAMSYAEYSNRHEAHLKTLQGLLCSSEVTDPTRLVVKKVLVILV